MADVTKQKSNIEKQLSDIEFQVTQVREAIKQASTVLFVISGDRLEASEARTIAEVTYYQVECWEDLLKVSLESIASIKENLA